MRYFLRCLLTACLWVGMSAMSYAEEDENGITPNTWIKFDEQSVGTISAATKLNNSGSNTATLEVSDGSIVANDGSGMAWTMGSNSYQPSLTKNSSVNTTTYMVRVNFNEQVFSSEKVIFAVNGKNYQGPALSVAGGGSSDYTVRLCRHSGGGKNTEVLSCTVSKEAGYHWFALTTSGQAMNTSVFYVDGSVAGTISKTDAWYNNQNNFYVFGKWGGNGGDAVPTGIIYDDIRSYEQVLTEDQIKKITGAGVTATWGNAGNATVGGVLTKPDNSTFTSDQKWTINFSDTSGMAITEIGAFGSLSVSSISIASRSGSLDATLVPASVTLTQNGVSVTSSAPTTDTTIDIYQPDKAVGTNRYRFLFDFADGATIDTTESFTLTINKNASSSKIGIGMMLPANETMGGSYSPMFEITGVYTESTDPRTFETTLDGTKKWSELEWSPSLPEKLYSRDTLQINVSGSDPTLLMDAAFSSSAKIEFSDAVTVGADESLYEDGCWQKDILKGSSIAATSGAISTPAVISGFVGAYSTSSSAIALRAQNKEVISINFANGQSVSGTAYAGLAPVQGDTWMNMTETWSSGGKTVDLGTFKVTADGSTVATRSAISGSCYAANTWGWNSATDVFLKGYLDDGGNQAQITVNDIPYSSYDVIVYRATDSAGYGFAAVSVNGKSYTYDSANPATAKEGTDKWGASQAKTAAYGTNALRIRDIRSATLTIVGGANANSARGCIAAIQIVCTGTIESVHDFTTTLSGSATFGDIVWNEGPFEEGVLTTATITNDASSAEEVTITFDNPSVTMARLKVVGSRNVRLVATSALANVTDVDMSECTGRVRYELPVASLVSSERDVVYAGGTAEGATVAIAHNGGTLNLEDGEYRLQQSTSDTATTVNMTDVVVSYSDVLGVGMATYVVGGNASVTTPSFVLSQGAEDRTAAFTVKDTASVSVTGTTDADSNKNSVMFGHWDGPSTFTLRDEATFTAASQVLVGKTANNHTINIDGGTFTAKGIRASASATGANALNLSGGSLVLGEAGISSYGSTTIAVSVKGDSQITSSALMLITQPVTIDADTTLTLDASAGDIRLTGKLVNNGTIRVIGGNVILIDADAPGTCVTEGTGAVKFGYVVDINSCGKKKIPDGKTWNEMLLFDANGNEVEITDHDDKYVYFEWEITGSACWWDYEFDGNGNNSGTEGTALSWDGGHPFTGSEYTDAGELHVPARPWRGVSSWPATATFVTYSTMVGTDSTYQLGFGSTYAGSKYTVFLATDKVSEGKVNLCLAYEKNAPTVLCSMSVPNAQTAKHLYAFVLKTVDGKLSVNTYLDGDLLQPYTHDTALTPGSGFQIGSGHGGRASGYSWAADDDAALMDWLRVYEVELGEAAMAEYAKRYPYVSPNGSYQRDVTGSDLWDKAAAWTKEGTSTTASVPAANSTVKIDADDASELAVNLTSDVIYEAIQIKGTGPFALVKYPGYYGKVRSSGRVTVSTDATFSYEAVDLKNTPVKVEDGCTLTFDVSSIDLDSVWSSATYDLTGLVTTGAESKVVCTYGTVPVGRTVSYGIDPADGHFKFYVTTAGNLTADLEDDATFGELVWKVGDVVVYPVWSKSVYGTVNVLKENATLTFDTALASEASILSFAGDKAVTIAAGDGAAVTGVTYDFTGLDAKATFAYNPDPTAVRAGYVRYDLDMGTYSYDAVLPSAGGRYEFKKIRIDGNGYDYHDRTVIVQDGDYLLLHDGTNLGCGLSLDVCGGEVHIGNLEGRAAIAYGRNGTRFNQSGGTVTVHANGTTQTGVESGFVLAHSATGGGCHEFNVTGGIFAVPESSVCFNEETNTINVSKSGVVRAKGAFSAKNASTGAVNVMDGGTFEVGSLGVKDGACALAVNGGTLCGYEDGATVSCAVAFSGEAKVSSATGTALTLAAANSAAGTMTVAEGTVRLGNAAAFGAGGVTVADGATLDLNGLTPGNAIAISGTGADGSGALVNNGAAISFKSNVKLADDAVIGGTGSIENLTDSAIDLGGHALTIGGSDAFVFSLGDVTVQGGGQVQVTSGTLASAGAAALGDADLSVGEKGTLDLSAGTSVSCRNFSADAKGTVVGEAATLSVSGAFDASSSVSVPKLSLANGATLKGVGLVVTSQLALGKLLYVTGVTLSDSIRIATVPAEAFELSEMLVVNGQDGYELKHVDKALYATKGGGVLADVSLDAVAPWANFEQLLVSGKVSGFSGWALGETNVSIVAVAADGSSVTQRFAYAGSEAAFAYEVAGLRAGGEYQVHAFVTVGESVCAVSKSMSVFTANTVGKWIDESADTFDTAKNSRTGQWKNLSGESGIVTEAGKSYISLVDAEVEFYPTNVTPTVVNSPIRDVSVKASFKLGFAVQVGEHAGVRLATNETGQCRFEVKLDDDWSVVSRATFAPEADTEYEIMVRLDETKGTAAYVLVAKDGNVELASGECEPTDDFADFCVAFAGTGAIDSLVGECHDTNLCRQYGFGEEYPSIDAAVEALGSEAVIEPVWRIAYRLHENSGSFTCLTNELLTVAWDKWYRVTTEPGTEDGSVKYSYCAANNWIEYADESGVEPMAGGWLVTNEVGLAWLAESATNKWLAGNVALGADLDLSSKNWTPIAQFTGTFDGRGHTITGLNNTNVIVDAVLGESGHYYGGTENDWGYTAYGLFGCATNAAFSNVTFADVAISNTADSAAALLGVHAGGDLAVFNVTNVSGLVRGEGRAVAGLLTLGGDGAAIGNVVVTNNANFATVAGSLANDGDGGNVAQILAGTTWGTRFEGDVAATNNVGEGAFDVRVTDGAVTKGWNASGFSWLDLPVCNFASAVIRTDTDDDFWSYVEANDPQAVVIDPFLRTARMSAGYFANGDKNIAGWWRDTISAMPDGSTATLEGTGGAYDVWNTVVVDRNITFDLNENCVYGVYDCDVFDIAGGKTLTLKNGSLYYAEGYLPTNGTGRVGLTDVTMTEMQGSFYDRTVPVAALALGEDSAGKFVTLALPFTSANLDYYVDSTTSLGGDVEWTSDVAAEIGTGTPLTIRAPAAGSSGFYRVRIVDPYELAE